MCCKRFSEALNPRGTEWNGGTGLRAQRQRLSRIRGTADAAQGGKDLEQQIRPIP